VVFSLPQESVPATLAYVRLLILSIQGRDPRKASRLLLDFLDVRTEHQAGRLDDVELRAELQRIGADAQAESAPQPSV
jgi:hypothetical protein